MNFAHCTKQTWGKRGDWDYLEAEAYRTKGELLLKAKNGRMEDEAEAYFLQAIEIARAQQAKSWELRAAMSLARLWRQNGQGEEARLMLADIDNWFSVLRSGYNPRKIVPRISIGWNKIHNAAPNISPASRPHGKKARQAIFRSL